MRERSSACPPGSKVVRSHVDSKEMASNTLGFMLKVDFEGRKQHAGEEGQAQKLWAMVKDLKVKLKKSTIESLTECK